MAGIKCRPRLVDFLRQYLLVKDVRSVGHESLREGWRSRSRAAFGKLRGRAGFSAPRGPRLGRLHQGTAGTANVIGRCPAGPAAALCRRAEYFRRMVDAVPIAGAQLSGSAV